MKKTIMNIRTMAALLIASAAFTACSNEDGAMINEQPAATQTPQVYTLTLDAGMDDNAPMRALAFDGTKLVAKWAAGDQLTVRNVTTHPAVTLGGTLTASNVSADGKTCTFSGTLTGTIAANNTLVLFYHDTPSTQDGTLASAAANEQAFATVQVASVDEGNITISGGAASFTTSTAVLKLTLKDGSANALNATSLKISVDGTDFFEATPTAATYTTNGAGGVLYFAVPNKDDAAFTIAEKKNGGAPTPEQIDTWSTNLNTYTVTFTAKVGDDTYTATKTGYKLAGGKYYATELTMAKVLTYPVALSAVTADYIGSVVTTDGNVYAKVSDATTAGKTAAAMIAYVGTASDCAHGLAIALADESGTKEYGAAGTACSGKAAVTGGTWRLPSIKDWQYMFIGCGASGSYSDNPSSMSYSGLASKLTTAQGDALQSSKYWSSTEYSHDYSLAWCVKFDGSNAGFSYTNEEYLEFRVRACLAF